MSRATMAFVGKVVAGVCREDVGGGEKTSVQGSSCCSGAGGTSESVR